MLAALLPRAANLQVPPKSPYRLDFLVFRLTPPPSFSCSAMRQVASDGGVMLVSGANGKSNMRFSGENGLGPGGVQRLADLLGTNPPETLVELSLRHPPTPPRERVRYRDSETEGEELWGAGWGGEDMRGEGN